LPLQTDTPHPPRPRLGCFCSFAEQWTLEEGRRQKDAAAEAFQTTTTTTTTTKMKNSMKKRGVGRSFHPPKSHPHFHPHFHHHPHRRRRHFENGF
jgi:hypothetical protein